MDPLQETEIDIGPIHLRVGVYLDDDPRFYFHKMLTPIDLYDYIDTDKPFDTVEKAEKYATKAVRKLARDILEAT